MKKIFMLSVNLLGCLYLTNAPSSNCSNLIIKISNHTKHECILYNQLIIHGRLTDNSLVPTLIATEQEASFEMTQSYLGPKIDLEYHCGDEQIRFSASQGLCFAIAGYADSDLISADKMYGHAILQDPSYWSDIKGIVHWVFAD